jgi:protein-L-isoaspartate(D-aspartate) O-methyltransferase
LESYQDTYKHKGLRKLLVEQLKGKGITDEQVIHAISTLPRHYFLPFEFESHAYEDKAFPILEGQTISQPYTVAYQSQLLNLKKGDKILEIGTGSGYQAAVLALCEVDVYSIERHQALSISAAKMLKMLNLNNRVFLFHGDGTKGLIKHAPYDGIIVTAGAPSVPKSLVNQLKVGGRLIIPVGKDSNVQKMVRLTKLENSELKTEVFEEFSFVPLLGENGWKI